MDKIKEQLKEQLENNRFRCSEKCYDAISDIIEYYNFDNEDEFTDHIYEEIGEAFIYYADAYEYLQSENITDFKDALNSGFGENVCSIASYYLEEEISSFIYDYMDLSIIDKWAEIRPYLDYELQDDETQDGGISYSGETLFDFLQELGDDNITTLEEVNETLIANGIKPIEP